RRGSANGYLLLREHVGQRLQRRELLRVAFRGERRERLLRVSSGAGEYLRHQPAPRMGQEVHAGGGGQGLRDRQRVVERARAERRRIERVDRAFSVACGEPRRSHAASLRKAVGKCSSRSSTAALITACPRWVTRQRRERGILSRSPRRGSRLRRRE